MFSNLFVKCRHIDGLFDFAVKISKALGIKEDLIEERQSSNYLNKRYLRIRTIGLSFIIANSDEERLEDNYFWISVKPDGIHLNDSSFLEGFGDLLARRLAIVGFEVIFVKQFGCEDEVRLQYQYDQLTKKIVYNTV